jgi:hypothetical protein
VRPFFIAAAVAAAVMVAGCADDAESRAGETSAPSTTLTTSPPPAPLSRDEAAARYLAIVEPYNLALEGLEQAINDGQAVATLRAQAEATATANDAHMLELQATVWPTDVQPAVGELLSESALAQTYWLQAAEAQTRDAVIEAAVAAGEHDGSEAASTIRSLLGLDGYSEDDYS